MGNVGQQACIARDVLSELVQKSEDGDEAQTIYLLALDLLDLVHAHRACPNSLPARAKDLLVIDLLEKARSSPTSAKVSHSDCSA